MKKRFLFDIQMIKNKGTQTQTWTPKNELYEKLVGTFATKFNSCRTNYIGLKYSTTKKYIPVHWNAVFVHGFIIFFFSSFDRRFYVGISFFIGENVWYGVLCLSLLLKLSQH